MKTRRSLERAALAAAVVVMLVAACGRSSSTPTSSPSGSGPGPSGAATSSTVTAAGSFGTEKHVCGPGPGTGGSGRGIIGKTIRIGTLADPGAAAVPGLGQEFFDVADAFSKWCNAAGGINGRKIVVDKLDAALFNGGARVIEACQKDFMLVGGATALDAPTAKPRAACKLGAIPAYTASPEAASGPYQVVPAPSIPTRYGVGGLRLLAEAYPAAKQGLGIAGSSVASLAPQGLRAQEAYQDLGFKVSTLQPRPALVDNYRPWIEQMKQAGAKADFEVQAQDPQPIWTAMSNVGWSPAFVLFAQTFYSPKSIQAARSIASFPPAYVNISNVPWELAKDFPVVQEAKKIMEASSSNPSYTAFTALGFDTWTLWAESATACGDNLTQACVLKNAAAHRAWTAGGFFAPVNTDPKAIGATDCTLLVRVTKAGFVYDKKATQPNNGIYNCDPSNLAVVKTYQGAG